MNLKPVCPVRLIEERFQCCECGRWDYAWRMMADLDGEPFRAYYCQECATKQKPEVTHE